MSSAPTPGTAAPDADVQRKYIEERAKRVRSDGLAQFVELGSSDLKEKVHDPWADHTSLNTAASVLNDGDRVKHLIVGTGIFGLIFAARLIDAGIDAVDIRFVDAAAGFGGVWYWNRYPGLTCDTESYVYMPLLEETGYVPTQRYATGTEIREQVERAARQYGVINNAQWRSQVHSATWDDAEHSWTVALEEYRGPDEPVRKLRVHAQFLLLATGAFVNAKLPNIPGLDTFQGQLFHSSRWDYSVTGGSQSDPTLSLLKDKVVGLVGNGASGVQVVPEVAKWAKEVYFFQRTPASVDVRDQRLTDPVVWETKIAAHPGWQRARQDNFNKFLTGWNSEADVDLVDDSWTRMRAGRALFGGRGFFGNILTPELIPAHIAKLHEVDLPRTERIRARVDDVVKDPSVAEKLKPWYPSWCKRQIINDDYLPTFNRPNVTLVDTDGKGLSALTPRGVVAANTGVEYPVDVLIFSTGFSLPILQGKSPAALGNLTIVGRDGRDMEEFWNAQGATTLHGLAVPGFPNLFFSGGSQAAPAAGNTLNADVMAEHVAYIIAEATRRAAPVVEATQEAADEWAQEVVARAAFFAYGAGCTPSFWNSEGERDRPLSPEQQLKMARGALWSEGAETYSKILAQWRADGEMKGYVL